MSLSLLRFGKLASFMKYDLVARTLVAATTSKKPKAPKVPKQPKTPKQAKPEQETLTELDPKELLGLVSKPVLRSPSGYNIYVKERYDTLRQNNPNLSANEVLRSLSQQWRSMDPTNKASFLDAAEAQRSKNQAYTEYRSLLSQKVTLSTVLKSIRKAGLMRSAPRGPSGFNLFCRENYPATSGTMPERMKTIASMWSQTSESVKQQYNDRAGKMSPSKE